MAKTSTSLLILAVVVMLQTASVMSAKKNGTKTTKAGPCKNYELLLTKLETCPNSSVTFTDFNLTLSDDCKVVPTGCVTSAPFNTAMVRWNITSTARLVKGQELTGEADGCKEMTKIPANTLAIMQSMSLSTSCPMQAAKTCANATTTGVNFKKYKDYMWMATGVTTVDINVQYDVGVACVKFEVTMRNKNGRAQKTDKQIMDAKKKMQSLFGK